jgi:hypothetical protein
MGFLEKNAPSFTQPDTFQLVFSSIVVIVTAGAAQSQP